MTLFRLVFTAGMLAAAPGPRGVQGAEAAAPRISHDPIVCAVAGLHPQVQAEVVPADEGTAVRVRFTTDGSKGWFAVPLAGAEGPRRGILPRPKGGLREFRYQIEATGAGAEPVRTPEHTVRVVRSATECPGKVADIGSPSGTLIVDGPPNPRRRKHPPVVPAGFNPMDVAGHVGAFDISTRTAVVAAILAGGAAVAGARAAGGEHSPLPTLAPVGTYSFALVASSPSPGSMVSLTGGTLAVVIRARLEGQNLAPGFVVLEMRRGAFTAPCVTLSAEHGGLQAGQPRELTVRAPPFTPAVSCGTTFVTDNLRVRLVESGGRDVVATGRGELPDIPTGFAFVP